MAGMCCGVVGEIETSAPVEPSSRPTRRRRTGINRFNLTPADMATSPSKNDRKRQKIDAISPPQEQENESQCRDINIDLMKESGELERKTGRSESASSSKRIKPELPPVHELFPKFGFTSVKGRRRDMEDAVSIHPSFCGEDRYISSDTHFFGVYDGHGCSHVAMKCNDRMHEIVKDELQSREVLEEEAAASWNESMKRSFYRMDKEVTQWNSTSAGVSSSNCRCELQTPRCDAVGSTAVVAVVTPEKIIVSNCGDSRAVLCRNGLAIPLSSDHKPDRADELVRIEEAGGRVIYWDGPRVLGILAMSRAIGDSYLKPYVIPEPDVTITDRTAEDECLILASDGLWDVVSNDTACSVARMCLRAQRQLFPPRSPGSNTATGESSDKACSDASILLTKLALARHSTDNVSVVVVDLKRDL
ncbi:hypothetical protein LguiA_023713 [Lonicera macranthoides]